VLLENLKLGRLLYLTTQLCYPYYQLHLWTAFSFTLVSDVIALLYDTTPWPWRPGGCSVTAKSLPAVLITALRCCDFFPSSTYQGWTCPGLFFLLLLFPLGSFFSALYIISNYTCIWPKEKMAGCWLKKPGAFWMETFLELYGFLRLHERSAAPDFTQVPPSEAIPWTLWCDRLLPDDSQHILTVHSPTYRAGFPKVLTIGNRTTNRNKMLKKRMNSGSPSWTSSELDYLGLGWSHVLLSS